MFELTTKAHLTVGDEVEISYGDDKPTLSFLLHYGFLTSATESDFITITCHIAGATSQDSDIESKVKPLPPAEVLAHIGPDGFVENSFLHQCGTLSPPERVSEVEHKNTFGLQSSRSASASSEQEAVRTGAKIIQDVVKQHITSFTTSLEEDKVIISDQDLSLEMRTAVATRIRFKTILERLAERLSLLLLHRQIPITVNGGNVVTRATNASANRDTALLVHRLHEPDILLGGQIARSLSLYHIHVRHS